ncbi:hypothetical protein RFI_19395 [Reticulomyxa filosa]|uniref:Uncharacterized protein n=1 Tax=Reticulomyxa filosa TaxID=46433 RepID=X6MXX1_RETFI|nr:hypothetical protein RFI_19395 [Reticulomyxa filosa]|eukprot:ETO17910.1 hypothetical protein RFI_19395 [Reticulomyxa filosa]
MKDNATSGIDITLYSSSILPITLISKPRGLHRQKIETWDLRNNKWEQFRLRLKKNIENWMKSIDPIASKNQDSLDKAVESWTKCVKTIWKVNKPWWSDSLSRLRKRVQKSKNRFRKQRTPRNLSQVNTEIYLHNSRH